MAAGETFYFFKDGSVVLLLHNSNNQYAAKKAMLKMYGRSESDISHTGSKCVGKSYQTFDGTREH